jgi:hypothetical protein
MNGMTPPLSSRPSGLSGDPYTIYQNAERLMSQNGPSDPNYMTYKMQMENALMQMRSPAYRGRRPPWLEQEIGSYPRMPGIMPGPKPVDMPAPQMPESRGEMVTQPVMRDNPMVFPQIKSYK